MTGVAVPRRLMLGLLLGYSLFLAFVLLTPTSDVPSSGVARLTDLALDWGLPHVTPVRVEFLCNVVLLVPFAVLGSLALPRWSWQDWTAWGFLLAGAVELTQGLVLPARDPSYADVVANTLGALLGAWLVVAVRYLASRPAPDLESWT